MSHASLLDTALHYAQQFGWAVHPVDLKKKPITPHGRNDATRDESTIRRLFHNGAQIGVATGPESKLFVLDVDLDEQRQINGYATLEYLESKYGALPDTPRQRTGRGGTQYLFNYADGLKNSAGKLGAGIDTRGMGGYIVAAPSRNTNGPYEWLVSPDETPLADVPQWLIDLLQAPDASAHTSATNTATADDRAYCLGKLGQAVARLAMAADGTKHDTLVKMAYWMGGYVPTLSETEIEDALYAAIAGRAKDPVAARKSICEGIASGKDKQIDIAQARARTTHIHERFDPATGEILEDTPIIDQDTRPSIDRTTIDLPTIMPLAWDAVVTTNDPPLLFRRAGELARLERSEQDMLIVKTIDTRRMAGILARAARWVRVNTDKHDNVHERETVPPPPIVDDAMVNIDPRIPALTRIVHAPSFTDGDLLLSEPGYHPSAKIYYDPGRNVVVPPVPATPTDDDLARAKATVFDDLLIDFPFVSDADRAHAVALLLLPFVRELISGPTPLHLIEAPTMGTGKGLLAEMLLFPALGVSPTAMTEAATDEEWGKVITSNLLMAPTAIYIDNLNRMLASGKLAAALTAREYSDRVLGSSEQVSLPVRCVWVATANNPTLSTEISRRCIRIRIDPRLDEPWKRAGFRHVKLRSWVETNRGQLIWAALIICRYGMQHGTTGPALGSYENWSDVMGQILHGASIPGFLGNLDVLYARADAEGNAWRGLLGAWWELYGDEGKTAGDLYPLVAEVEADALVSGREEIGRKKSFGKALARVLDRVFTVATDTGSVRLQIADGGISHKVRLWKLVSVEAGGLGGVGGFGTSAPARDHVHNIIEIPALDIRKPPTPPKPPGINTDPAFRDIGFLNRGKPRAGVNGTADAGLFDDGDDNAA